MSLLPSCCCYLYIPFLSFPGLSIKYPDLRNSITLIIVLFLTGIAIFGGFLGINKTLPVFRNGKTIVFLICLFLIGTSINAIRLFDISHVNDWAIWWTHLDAVVSPVAQVLNGKHLLTDIPSQYGLFPVLIAPVLRILPSGLKGFTIFMGAIQALSLVVILLFIKKQIQSAFVFLYCSISLIVLTFSNPFIFKLSNQLLVPDPYFQYWPIRFVFPALSIPLVHYLYKRISFQRILLLSAFVGLALLWNMDSGIAIFYATSMLTFLVMALKIRGKSPHFSVASSKRLVFYTCLLPFLSLTFFGLGLLLLSVGSGQSLKLEWLSMYQVIFYNLGYFMMPMPASLFIWQTVISVYIISLVVSNYRLNNGDYWHDVLPFVYLPLLGAGLFSYYQGRSHFLNIISVCWPAILIAGLLADKHLYEIKKKRLSPVTIALPIAAFLGFILPNWILFRYFGEFASYGLRVPFEKNHPFYKPSKNIASELQLIKESCSDPAKPCFIITQRQGIYSLEAGISSELKGPSPIEIILRSDRDKLFSQLRNGIPEQIILGIKPESKFPHLKIQPSDLRHYKVAKTNPEGTIALLVRVPEKSSRLLPGS